MSEDRELALKGRAVEEWLDVRFFRPVGMLLARAVLNTRVTPNQITIASLVLGLGAAHLFFYEGWIINLTAFVLVVVADLLDSSDGQLARLRGSASRTGRMLDGFADTLRWITVYVHLALRAWAHGHGLWVFAAAAAAGYVHSLNTACVDILTYGYLELGEGRHAVDLPEELGEPPAGWFWRHAWPFYAGFVRTQGRMFRHTVGAVRRSRQVSVAPEARQRFARRARGALTLLPCFGQNAHIVVLGAAGIAGQPLVYFAVAGIGMAAAAFGGVVILERAAARFSSECQDPKKAPEDGPASS